MLEEKA